MSTLSCTHGQIAAHLDQTFGLGFALIRMLRQGVQQACLQGFAAHLFHHLLRIIGDLRREADIVYLCGAGGLLNCRRNGCLITGFHQFDEILRCALGGGS